MQHQWELVAAQTFAVFQHVRQPVTFCDKQNARVCEVIGRDSIVTQLFYFILFHFKF